MEALRPVKFIADRLKDVRGGAWGDMAESFAGRIAFINLVNEAEAETPSSNVVPIHGVGIPDRPHRPRAA